MFKVNDYEGHGVWSKVAEVPEALLSTAKQQQQA